MPRYEIVYADLPWEYTSFGTAALPYKCMTEAQIKAFPIEQFMAKRCVLFLWVTGPKLMLATRCFASWQQQHGLRYLGKPYTWVKTTSTLGKRAETLHAAALRKASDASGPWRTAFEKLKATIRPCDEKPIGAAGPRPTTVKPLGEDVLAFTNVKRGRPFPLLTEAQVQWCSDEDNFGEEAYEVHAPKAKRGEHSRKPDVVRRKIVELFGDRPRVELFARERVAGWDGWGDEYPSGAAA